MAWNEGIKKDLGHCGSNVFIGYNCVFTNPKEIFLGDNVRIDPFTLITTRLITGNYIHICSHAVLSGGAKHTITLGNWSWIGYHSSLFCASESYDGDHGPVMEFWNKTQKVHHGDIVFEDYGGIASHCLVMPGIRVPEGCAIGAGSKVLQSHGKKLESWGLFYGEPLIKKRTRNKVRILEVANNIERGAA